jgi:hypothetical protein
VTRRILTPWQPPAPNRKGTWAIASVLTICGASVLAGTATSHFSNATSSDFNVGTGFAILALVAFAGFVVLTLGWRLPGVRMLYPEPWPKAIAAPQGLELHIPNLGVCKYGWEEVGSLVARHRGRGVLRSPTGDALVEIPGCLMSGGRTTLARFVVASRPDRFVLGRHLPLRPATEFRLAAHGE